MTARVLTVAVFTVLGLSVFASAQRPSSRSRGLERLTRPAAASARTSPHSAFLLLRKRVENIDWIDTPFEEVLDWLKSEGEARVNVVPRWTPLGAESVDLDTLVTLQLINTTVAEVLSETVDQLSLSGEVTFRAVGNTLKISTRADFNRKMEFRVYDVTDILFRVQDFGQEAPLIDLQQTNSGGQGGGGGGQSVFQGAGGQGGAQSQGGEQAEQELEERLEELRELIEETIEPDSWDTAATGGLGRIRIFNRSLVVTNTIEVHEMIAGRFFLGE